MNITIDTRPSDAIRIGPSTETPTHRDIDRIGAPTVRRAGTARDWAQAASLLRQHAAWIEGETGIAIIDAQPAFAAELEELSEAYGSPRSALLVADDGERVRGIVAVRHHDDGSAELKRMFVDPAARGHGYGGRLVREAIRVAERWSATHLWLETLPGVMDPAIAMYTAHGFRRVGPAPLIDIDAAILMVRDLGGPGE